jgi:hypothetical protein
VVGVTTCATAKGGCCREGKKHGEKNCLLILGRTIKRSKTSFGQVRTRHDKGGLCSDVGLPQKGNCIWLCMYCMYVYSFYKLFQIVGLDLHQIPLSVSRLTRLQTLNMSRNKLTTLPLTITSQLRELIVASNLLGQAAYKTWKFFSLPQIIDNLQNLDLSGNQVNIFKP